MPRIIEFLRAVRNRPHLYFDRIEVERAADLLHGFRLGCFASINLDEIVNLHVRVRREILAEGAKDLVEMRQSNATENEIIDQMFDIEIETWRRLEGLLSSVHPGGIDDKSKFT